MASPDVEDALRGGRLGRMQEYVAALQEGDLDRVLELFTPRGKVVSPLEGKTGAKAFYAQLFGLTRRSRVRIIKAYLSEDGSSAAAHLDYDWTLTSGQHSRFECVDLFRFDEKGKIRELKIFYDPAGVREDHEAARRA